MTEWFEKPYAGGPMAVPAAYFPRPLYPPDAAPGKTPSKDGPDVLAYKRTLCRLGRWGEWTPSSWDDTFANGFAHGQGPNVADTGIAGFQRQMGIEATGFIGKSTFNTLASCRVPEGRPHVGEMAMDANSVNLIVEAFEVYGGQALPPAPPVAVQTTRQRALAGAAKWIGYIEGPESNETSFGAWYGMNYQPWCAMFATYCFVIEAGGSPSFARASRYSYVPYIVNDAKAGRNGLAVTNSPIPGDLVCYDWHWDGEPDHVGLFESGTATAFNAIEGNTSPANNSNGGQVMRRARHSSDAKITFVRVYE